MSGPVKQQAVEIAADTIDWQWVVFTISMGLGISTIPAIEFWGGMFLALAGSLMAWKLPSRHRDVRRFVFVIMSGFVVAYVAAIAHPSLTGWLQAKFSIPVAPVQLWMLFAGFASKWIVKFVYDFLERMGAKGETLADRVLPEDDK